MKTTLKRTVVVAGLFGTGSLLAYGPGFGGLGFLGHHGAQHSSVAGHMIGAGYGPGTFIDGDVDARLNQIKTKLAIRPQQEAAWNSFANSLEAHAAKARSMYQTHWPQRRTVTDKERDGIRESLWQERRNVHEAAGKLLDALDEQQRVIAGDLISYGLQHPF